MKQNKTDVLELPDKIQKVEKIPNPRDLVVIGTPKSGKSAILADFTKKHNALILNLEKGGYEYLDARVISSYETQQNSIFDSFFRYIQIRKLLIKEKGKYEFLIIDGLSDLDALSEIGGTLAYQDSNQGKNFNRPLEGKGVYGERYAFENDKWEPVTTLAEGFGYQHTRKWFLQQIEFFREIAPYRIYAAHIADKYIKTGGHEDVVTSEISLTGKLKSIFASRVTALSKLVVEDNERYLNFDALNETIIAGSRSPKLTGKILISRKNEEGGIETFWESIYNFNNKSNN